MVSKKVSVVQNVLMREHETLVVITSVRYRRLISKSAFMQFLAIFTFLHIWEDVGRGYLKMQGP